MLMGFAFFKAQGQSAVAGSPTVVSAPSTLPESGASRITERGSYFKKVEFVKPTVDTIGRALVKTSRYTVLANGLNYLDASSNWVESCPVVRSFAGGIVCTGASYRVILSSNLNRDDAVDLETPDKQRIISHPLGIGFYDPDSGKSVLLAQIQDCRAEALSSNQVVYRDAFASEGIEASVIYTYGIGRFHQDVVLTRKPALSPSDFGLGTRARLEMMSELVEFPLLTNEVQVLKQEKNQAKRVAMAEPDLVDETPIFTEQWRMTSGKAFLNARGNSRALCGMTVTKHLLNSGAGRAVLVEAVEWDAIVGTLNSLPAQAVTVKSLPAVTSVRKLPHTNLSKKSKLAFETRLAQITQSKPVLLAYDFAVGRTAPAGFVIDYEVLQNANNVWLEGGTYYCPNEVDFYGLETLDAQSLLIKFGPNGDIMIHDHWDDFPADDIDLTSVDDDTMGDVIDGSSGNPSGYCGGILIAPGCTFQDYGPNCDFRFQTVGISFGANPSSSSLPFWNCYIRNCWIGFDLGNTSDLYVPINNVFVCGTEQLIQNGDNDNVQIGYTDEANHWCSDLDNDGFDDNWERQYFGHLGVDGNADPDGDGFSNVQEFLNGTDPTDRDSIPPVRLGYWRFDNTNTWEGETGQLPLTTNNLVGVRSWSTNAVLIDSTNPAILCYRDAEANGHANINLRSGTVRFWFKPDWSSADQGGTGPQNSGRLIEVGDYHPEFTNGWWALFLNSGGTQLTFGSSTNGAGNTSFSANISWAFKHWHQIALTYSPTNAVLYFDGQAAATNDTGPNYYPNLEVRANGFRIGSDAGGGNQARGVFEDLETFSYRLNANDIFTDYAAVTNSMPALPTVVLTHPTNGGTYFVSADRTLSITVNAQAATGLAIQNVAYSYEQESLGDPEIGVSTQSPFSFNWQNTNWTDAFRGRYTVKAVAEDNTGVASDAAYASHFEVDLDADGNGLPDYWEIQYFGTNGLDPNSVPTGNHQTILYDYQHGIDPTDYYHGILPHLGIAAGEGQNGADYLFLPTPLTVSVVDYDGVALTNAPVVFTVTSGIAQIAATTTETPSSTLSLRTDGNGLVSIWCYFPPGIYDTNMVDSASTIQAQALNAVNSAHVTFHEGMVRLAMISGDNQGGDWGSFLPMPVTVQELGINSAVLTNAPLVFSVADGTALLAATTGDTPVSSLAVETDSHGQANVWIYLPPSSSNPPASTIWARASVHTNAVAIPINEYALLGHWRFDDTNTWTGTRGQLPLLASNVVGAISWSSNAVLVDSTNTALLAYRVVETNGNASINCQTGSILFYFKPDWNSGAGPGSWGRLIEMGNYSSDLTNGWWSLFLNPDGTQLMFAMSTNGAGTTNLIASILWASNTWYQIALAYSPTNSALFVDGQLAATGDGITDCLNADELADGFRIGSDRDGNNQAAGAFDELETFAQPLTTIGNPMETYWLGIPDYLSNGSGRLSAWELLYFGHFGLDPFGDCDNDGTNNLQEFLNGTDPNKISFSFSVPNQYVVTNVVNGVIAILGGIPSSIAVLVDGSTETNWAPLTSSNITVNIGTNPGMHNVWIGLRGRLETSYQAWERTTLILNSNSPTLAITSPMDNATFNASRVNLSGNFTATALKGITVNGILAYVNGTNFEVRNVPLDAGTNIITAVVEDLTGMTNAASITVTATTNVDGSLNDPVQLSATPVAGFAPLSVTFSNQANALGMLQQVLWDFNGDGITDFTTNNAGPVTWSYTTSGEYFPVVTLQTEMGRFSSIGGWNGYSLNSTNQPIRINVQMPATLTATLTNFPNPVDLKWDSSHLYVLSGSGAAIYEFATNGDTIRSLSLPNGSHPSGLDVDGAGNVYVTVTASNQVWKFNPATNYSFQADTNFGVGGCIGLTNGAIGSDTNEFNGPYDVAVSPDGQAISVSDSGNHRIQQFSAASGAYLANFGSQGSNVGQFNSPKGLTYDDGGTLYIVDSVNNRLVLAEGSAVMEATGTGGNGLGQFSGALNISVGKRGAYVADASNNRIQKFDLPAQGLFEITSGNVGYAVSTNLNSPAAVAAVDNLTNELFYVADTGNNRVILCHLPDNNPDEIQAVWNGMTTCVAKGDISGAAQYFCSKTADGYQQAFLCIGLAKISSDISDIGPPTPVYIRNNLAQYYFEQTVNGATLLFPIQFVRENGTWKIFEF